MSTGTEMKKIYDAMVQIYTETSQFMVTLEEKFKEAGWSPVGNRGMTWYTSGSIDQPEVWLPYFMQRVYTKDEPDKGIAFTIVFDSPFQGEKLHYPVISCAIAESTNKELLVRCNELVYAGWSDDSKPLDTEKPKFYQTVYDGLSIRNYLLPLERISDQQAIQKLIIGPLIQMYEGKIDEAYLMVKSEAKLLKEMIE